MILKKIIKFFSYIGISIFSILAILFISLSIYLNSTAFSKKATLNITKYFSKKINRLVEIEKLKFKIFPPYISIQELKIYGPKGKKEIPFCSIKELQLRLNLRKIFNKEIISDYLIINEAAINIIDYKKGKDNFPSWKKGKQEKSSLPISFNINKIRVNKMKIIYVKESIPLIFYTPNLNAQFIYDKNIRGFHTYLTFTEGKLKIQKYRDWIFSSEMNFAAKKDGLYFDSIKFISPDLIMFSKGIMKDYSEKIFDLDVIINFTGEKIKDWFFIPTVLKGKGTFEGKYKGTFSNFNIEGNYFINNFQIFRFRYQYIFGNFIMDSNALQLPHIYGRLAGGNFEGSFSINPLKGKSHYKVSILNSQLEQLSKWFKLTPILPTAKINFLGNLQWYEGAFKKFKGYFTSSLKEDKTYGSSYHINSESVRFPVNGYIRGYLNNYGIDKFDASLATEFSKYEIKGNLNFKGDLNLDVVADSANLYEVDLLYHLIETKIENRPIQEEDLWNIKGINKFAGKVEDNIFDIKFKGNFKGEKIWYRNVYWDRVEGFVQYKNRLFNLKDVSIRRDDEDIIVDYSIFNLGKKGFKIDGDISAAIKFNKFEAQDILKAIGWEFPLRGSLFGETYIDGSFKDIKISSNITLFNSNIMDVFIDSAMLSFSYEKKYLQVAKMIIKRKQSSLFYTGGINIDNWEFNDSNLSIKNIPLELAKKFIKLEIAGNLSGNLKINGNIFNPKGEINLLLNNFFISKIDFGNIKIKGNSNDGEANINIQKSNEFNKAKEIIAFLRLTYSKPHYYEFKSQLNNLMINLPAKFIKDYQSNFPLIISGNIDSKGNLDEFPNKNLSLLISKISIKFSGFKIKNNETFSIDISPFAINLPESFFYINEYEFSAKAIFDLSKKIFTSMVVNGDIDIKLIEKMIPDIFASGRGRIQLEAKESKKGIDYYGRLYLKDVAFKYKGLPLSLDNVSGTIDFNEEEISFRDIEGKGNGGDVSINGSLLLDGIKIKNFSIITEGKGIFFNYPKDLNAYGNFKINWFGNPEASLITGNAEIEQATWNKEITLGSLIEKSPNIKSINEDILKNIKLNISITTKKLAKFNAKFGNAEINFDEKAELYLLHTISEPVIMGRADTLAGTITFLGNEFKISKGIINFVNPYATTAQIDFIAYAYIKEYQIKLMINGTLDKFYLQFSSEPPLPQSDIWALLSGENIQPGKIRNIEGTGEESTLAALGSSYIANPLFGTIQKETKKILGLSSFQISPSFLSSETNPTAKITINKFITKDLSITYSSDLKSSKEQIILIEFKIAPNIIAVASRNEKGYFGLDFRLNKIF